MNARRATAMFRDAVPLRRIAPRWPLASLDWTRWRGRIRPFNWTGPPGRTARLRTLMPYAAALAVILVLAVLLSYAARRVTRLLPMATSDSALALSIAYEHRGEAVRPQPAPGGQRPAAAPREARPARSPNAGRSASSAAGARGSAAASGAAAVGAVIEGAPLPPAIEELRRRRLSLPVNGVRVEQLVPTFDEARGDRPHEALDIMAPRGTPVVATEDGRIARLFWSNAGGHTIYQFDPSERYVYYYAHLDRYADGLAEGQAVARGQTIGYVGSTGNAKADAPHLHFAIFLLTPEKRWWDGTALDPYPVLRWNIDGGTP